MSERRCGIVPQAAHGVGIGGDGAGSKVGRVGVAEQPRNRREEQAAEGGHDLIARCRWGA